MEQAFIFYFQKIDVNHVSARCTFIHICTPEWLWMRYTLSDIILDTNIIIMCVMSSAESATKKPNFDKKAERTGFAGYFIVYFIYKNSDSSL